ncbi:MAG: hypothetical protein NT075_14145 [Chloroflexi bacterium]|nr:hypothetical protein [Chloroflexota bacterium]
MNQPINPPPIIPADETTHSFVIRLWQETPGQWRGAVRHVQGESRLAFTRLDQAMRWIERTIEIEQPSTEATRTRQEATGWRTWWANLSRGGQTPTWAAAGVLAMLMLVIILTTQEMPGSLAGTAIGTGVGYGGLLPFLACLVLGGLAVVLWVRSTPKGR